MRGRRVGEGGIRKGRSWTRGILRELGMDFGSWGVLQRKVKIHEWY
jgi:hypothetical protein